MLKTVESYYQASRNRELVLPPLQADMACDVCIIGAGYTGLSAALHLAQRGYSVVVLEADTVAAGASGRNGGQVCSGQRQEQHDLEQQLGRDWARRLWDLSQAAKQLVRNLIQTHAIACDVKPGNLLAGHRPGDAIALQAYAEKLQRDYDYTDIRPVSHAEMTEMLGTTAYYGGSLDQGAMHLHPLNFALGLATAAQAAGAQIFEQARVLEYSHATPSVVRTAQHRITAQHLVLACNGYLHNLEPRIAGHMLPINSFILATEPLSEAAARALIRDDVCVADSKFAVNYFRLSADKRLLFGGGETYTRRYPRDLQTFARRNLVQIYPQLQTTPIDYVWGGSVAVTMNRLPHFGRLSPNVFFAQGFSGHGVALATLAGQLIAEALAGHAERFDVFARLPCPRFPGGTWLRKPLLVLGMSYYALRDRL